MKRIFGLIALVLVAGAAQAGGCEEEFEVIGDPRNGLLFSAAVKIPGLSIKSALGQLQGIAISEGLQAGVPVIEGERGEVSFIQSTNNPPVVIQAAATNTGFVTLETKLARGQKMDAAAGKAYMCGWLAKLKPGKAGEALASAAMKSSGSDRVADITAADLSKQLEKDVSAAMSAVNTPSMKDMLLGSTSTRTQRGDVAASFAPVRAKYLGRKYRIDGQVHVASINSYAKKMEVTFMVTRTRGLLNVRQNSGLSGMDFDLKCELAPDQMRFFARLQSNDWVKLEGTVSHIDEGSVTLSDCRQVN